MKENLADAYAIMGDIYVDNKKIALNYYGKALKYTKESHKKATLSLKISYVYLISKDKELDKASYFVTKALQYKEKKITNQAIEMQGRIEEAKGNYTFALAQYHLAMQYAKADERLTIQSHIARVLLSLGQQQDNEKLIKKAMLYAKSVILHLSNWTHRVKSFNGKIELKNRYSSAYTTIIKAKIALGQREEAFLEVQKYKGSSNISFAELKDKLKKNQTYLSFLFTKEDVLALTINKDKIEYFNLGESKDVKQAIDTLMHEIALGKSPEKLNPSKKQENATKIVSSASALYKQLIYPLQSSLKEELLIEPDAELCFLPFEALIINANSDGQAFRMHDYLIKHYTISYAYNSAMFLQNKNATTSLFNNKVLSIAPTFNKQQKLFDSLENNVPEAIAVEKIWGGKLLLKGEANKSNFIYYAADYNILHLSTHGTMYLEQPDSSFIAFMNKQEKVERMNVGEIYKLHLKADLVALSACQTASGLVYHGEGMMSIGKAFLTAGARNFVASIWNADDEYSFELMSHFYTFLKSSGEISNSLRKAKIAMFENGKNIKAHPYFWAGYIALGEGNQISSFAEWQIYTLLFTFVLLLGILIFTTTLGRSIQKSVRNYFLQR
jgi:CHAT domain-containing protein